MRLSRLLLVALAVTGLGALASAQSSRPSQSAGARAIPRAQVIAHRGASWDAPEHTFAAWDLALESGADWIEQDLQLTRDGVLVVFHDDSLDRVARGPVADCSGIIRDKTRAQLARCDVGTWFNTKYPPRAKPEFAAQRIPTLDEVLSRYRRRAKFYIELKAPEEAPGMEQALLEALTRHGLAADSAARARVIVQSFSAASLQRFAALAPGYTLVQLLGERPDEATLDADLARIATYARGIGPSRRHVNRTLVERAHANGLVIHPYTVNDEAEMRQLLSLGVDGMFTDRPGQLRRLLPY
jgi:glycerophosphoryl diester phosphodiesterase